VRLYRAVLVSLRVVDLGLTAIELCKIRARQ